MTTLDKPRVLIADADRWRSARLSRLLTDNGYLVVAAVRAGEEAVTGAKWLRPDLILLGVELDGETDGVAAAEEISITTSTPIVILDDQGFNRRIFQKAPEVSGFLPRTADDTMVLAMAGKFAYQSICSLDGSEWEYEQVAV